MECVTSASASVLVNGSPSGVFKMERGLRQGDPLSPFLFLIAAEGLNILMERASSLGYFSGAEIGGDRICISHLQYADDTILMGAATQENAVVIRRILSNMELLSGLRINFEKCSLTGVNVTDNKLLEMAGIIGCKLGTIPFYYLGIQVGCNHRKVAEWSHIVLRIKNKLQKWDDKKISIGGRITLLNSVLSSLPIYYLSFFLIPSKTVSEIECLQRNFLWGVGLEILGK